MVFGFYGVLVLFLVGIRLDVLVGDLEGLVSVLDDEVDVEERLEVLNDFGSVNVYSVC